MATVTKFVDTDAFSTTTFNNKIDEINQGFSSLEGAGLKDCIIVGTSVANNLSLPSGSISKTLGYTQADCDYYCTSNSSTNTTMLNNIFAQPTEKGFRKVVFLPGIYLVNNTLRIADAYQIEGRGGATIQRDASMLDGNPTIAIRSSSGPVCFDGIIFYNDSAISSKTYFVEATQPANIIIENCYFYNNGGNSGNWCGIKMPPSNRNIIKGNYFDQLEYGIELGSTKYSKIEDNYARVTTFCCCSTSAEIEENAFLNNRGSFGFFMFALANPNVLSTFKKNIVSNNDIKCTLFFGYQNEGTAPYQSNIYSQNIIRGTVADFTISGSYNVIIGNISNKTISGNTGSDSSVVANNVVDSTLTS